MMRALVNSLTRDECPKVRVADMMPETLPKLLKVLTWSLTALSNGFLPDRDHDGRLFEENYEPKKAAKAGKPLAGGTG